MTTNNSNQPKGDQLRLTTAQTAVPANIPAKSTVVIGGVSYTQAQLAAFIATLLAPILAAQNAKQAFATAVLARKQNQPAVKTFLAELRAAIISLFGRGSPVLAQFGFAPHKARTTTAGKTVVKTAKILASRKLLGTKGPQQKAQLLAQQPPAFSVSSTGKVTLTGGDASSTAPASASNTPASTAGSTAVPSGK